MPAAVTVVDAVVAPVLQDMLPMAGIDKTVLPQPLLTVTVGAAGVLVGVDIPEPDALVQPPDV
jgi:hypothetical protein